MLRIFLDAHVLAMPQASVQPGGGAREAFEGYVTQLLELNDARSSGFGYMFLPSDAEAALFATGLYPLWDRLSAALTASNLHDKYQPEDIVAVVNGFLKQLARLEDALRVSTVLADPVDLQPNSYLQGYPTRLANSHRDLMLLVCLLYRSCGRSPCGDFVIVQHIETRTLDITVRSIIHDLELMGGTGPCQTLCLPLDLNDQVRLISKWSNLLQEIDFIEAWRIANSAQERSLAFYGFLRSFAKTNGFPSSVASSISWSFGSLFWDTVDLLGFGRERSKVQRLLAAMAETVLKINLSQVHQLRAGQAGNDPQIKRGQDGAWRKDIDYEFHLHYWLTPVGPEFAAVVAHNDFDIPG